MVEEYDQLAGFLDKLLDIVGEDESHELIGLVDVVSRMITKFDEANYSMLD
jgi:HTH-type transcriptional regulator/antitoxin HigA